LSELTSEVLAVTFAIAAFNEVIRFPVAEAADACTLVRVGGVFE